MAKVATARTSSCKKSVSRVGYSVKAIIWINMFYFRRKRNVLDFVEFFFSVLQRNTITGSAFYYFVGVDIIFIIRCKAEYF